MTSKEKRDFVAEIEAYDKVIEVMGHIVVVRSLRIFIPKEVRESLNLKSGEEVEFSVKI